jgi:UDP-glucuronate 4-epimerase
MTAKRVLVTGAAGFVGSSLTKVLLDRGTEVIGIDNFNDYYNPKHKHSNVAEFEGVSGYKLYQADFRDAEIVEKIISTHKPDAIAHLGAMANVRYSVEHPQLYVDVNITGTLNLLQSAARHAVGNFVFASTSSVYGRRTDVPFYESDRTDLPLAPYPATKKAAEVLGHSFFNTHGLNFTVLRFFNVYGPKGRPDMMPFKVIKSLLNGEEITLYSGGELKRDWTFISDNLQGVVAALDNPLGYEVFNLGRGEPLSVQEMVRIAEKLVGKAAKIKDVPAPASEIWETFANVDKARAQLAYQPQVSLAEGMAQFWDWCQNNPDLLK